MRHVHTSEYNDVYAPAEDSYLLVDALQADMERIAALRPSVVVEVGSGSGVVLSSLGMTMKNCHFIGVDLNPKAVAMTERTLAGNGTQSFDVFRGKHFGGLRSADVVICNPPYVVTSDEEYLLGQTSADITASWAGGTNGRLFIDEFLIEVQRMMTPGGLLYLLVEERNKPSELRGHVVLSRKVVGESLQVLRLEF